MSDKTIPRIRPSWDEYFIKIAEVVATRSHDAQTQTGCVIVGADKRIVSTGYNGFPPGFPDDKLPNIRPDKYFYMVHAEANAIATTTTNLKGCTLYCTLAPCVDCAKLLLTAGIVRIVCKESGIRWKWDEVSKMLKMGNIDIEILKNNEE